MNDTSIRKHKPELTMPRTETGTDNLGIRYEGPVLSGYLGVQQELERLAVNSAQTRAQVREIAPGGVTYVERTDFEFCYHGLPIEPDPLRAWQRRELGNRPELYDPVLRHHTGLPPLPDPYDELRKRGLR
jgi:hypothetical protein